MIVIAVPLFFVLFATADPRILNAAVSEVMAIVVEIKSPASWDFSIFFVRNAPPVRLCLSAGG